MAGTYSIQLMKIILLFPGNFVHVDGVPVQHVVFTYLVTTFVACRVAICSQSNFKP